jgi:hypothetical protein
MLAQGSSFLQRHPVGAWYLREPAEITRSRHAGDAGGGGVRSGPFEINALRRLMSSGETLSNRTPNLPTLPSSDVPHPRRAILPSSRRGFFRWVEKSETVTEASFGGSDLDEMNAPLSDRSTMTAWRVTLS